MEGTINADLAAMPAVNMAILFGGAATLIVVTAIVIRKLGIKNIGPIKIEQRGQTTMWSMNEAAKDADDMCRRQMRQITSNMKTYVSNIFAEENTCAIARVAISSAIRIPLYESIANNHFTTELMPDNYGQYRSRIIEMLRDEYMSLAIASKGLRDSYCSGDPMPPWEQVSGQLIGCIDLWLKRISREVMLNCEKKKMIYEKYLPDFEGAKDDYRTGIVKKCIEKNERYITVLKDRIGREAA